MSDNVGLEGAPGNVDGSGVRWKMMEGLEGASTMSAALHDVSPVSLTALHVYTAVSDKRRPVHSTHTEFKVCTSTYHILVKQRPSYVRPSRLVTTGERSVVSAGPKLYSLPRMLHR